MLRPREELITQISKTLNSMVGKTHLQNQCTEMMMEKFGLPTNLIQPIFTLRDDPDMLNDFQLYCFSVTFDELVKNNKLVETFFTDKEIKGYSKSKQKSHKIKFPLDFKMVQISEDQWTGRLTLDEFKTLFESQIVYYNAATQRKLLHVVNGTTEYLKIDVNNESVDKIQELMENEEYIPDQITLNMDETADYSYDEETATLRINSLDHFDILDGYHRYKALVRAINKNANFNFVMELRIAQFSEDKCQQFIYQQDQHTKLKKIDSESLNQNNPANIIVKRLNGDSLCLLYKQINRNNGLIDSTIMSKAIDSVWFRSTLKSKSNSQAYIKDVTNTLIETINKIINDDKDNYLLEHKWEPNHILAIVYSSFIYKDDKNIDLLNLFTIMSNGIYNGFGNLDKLGDTPNSVILRNLNTIYKEVADNV